MMSRAPLLALLAVPLWAGNVYVTIAGLGGEPDYETRFAQQAQEIERLVRGSASEARTETLFGKNATRERVRAVFQDMAKSLTAQDNLIITLIGHGTFDGEDYKLNLPGPDVTAVELASLLDRVPARQLIINTTSASGASLAALHKANRAVITATKSGGEKNATVFARFWVEALRDPAADSDKNETVTALEAFRYADQKTKQFFDTEKRLATEHAILEDTGKGEGTRTPSPETGQGLLAARFPLLRLGAIQAAAKTPEKQKLLSRREDLERQIDELKFKKAAMPSDEYRKALTQLLLELSKTQAEIDK